MANWRTQLDKVKAESERAHHEAAGKIRELEQQLESERVQAKLVHLRALRALERLRAEHQLAIQRGKDAMDKEQKRMSAWVQDVKDSCNKEKGHLEARIDALLKEKETHVPEVGGATDQSTHASTERSEDSSTTPASDPTPPTDPCGAGGGGDDDSGSGGASDPTPSATLTDPATTSSTGDAPATGDGPRSTATGMVETMTTFLQAQAQAVAAHARATAAQQLPALQSYTEGKQAAYDGFERWIDRFKERAKVAGWDAEHQLYQLKVHLDQTAGDVFRMIPETERDTFDKAVAALGKRFKPKDIEELRGMEFYHVMQNESIEQLGITV